MAPLGAGPGRTRPGGARPLAVAGAVIVTLIVPERFAGAILPRRAGAAALLWALALPFWSLRAL